jgi:hypothetical protein
MVVQANVVQLKTADARHRGIPSSAHDIRVVAPGAVRHFREALIDHHVLARYSPQEAHLRLREVWGQFCLFCWLYSVPNTNRDARLADVPLDAEMHCETALAGKEAEVHALLWRIRFEQRLRQDRDFQSLPSYADDEVLARRIPAKAMEKPMAIASDEELLLAACEHAGMLAAVRWLLDRRRRWGEPGIMDVGDRPF